MLPVVNRSRGLIRMYALAIIARDLLLQARHAHTWRQKERLTNQALQCLVRMIELAQGRTRP